MFREIVFWEGEKSVQLLLEKLKFGISSNTLNFKAFGMWKHSLCPYLTLTSTIPVMVCVTFFTLF